MEGVFVLLGKKYLIFLGLQEELSCNVKSLRGRHCCLKAQLSLEVECAGARKQEQQTRPLGALLGDCRPPRVCPLGEVVTVKEPKLQELGSQLLCILSPQTVPSGLHPAAHHLFPSHFAEISNSFY